MTNETINNDVTIAGGGRTMLAGRYRVEDKYSTLSYSNLNRILV